jgi:F-type H+-transporting ATPase subunit gamma
MRSVKNISQVTRALEAVSASKVRRAQQQVVATRAYAGKAYQVLQHLGTQPGSAGSLHPLLQARPEVRQVMMVLITSDRGLCGAYNTNMVRTAMDFVRHSRAPVNFVTVGRKGRELLLRRRQKLIAEFSNLPGNPSFVDVSAIGELAVQEFLSGRADEVYLGYTDYINTLRQVPRVRPLLPLRTRPCWMSLCRALRPCRSIRPSWKRRPANTRRAWWPCATPPTAPRTCWARSN